MTEEGDRKRALSAEASEEPSDEERAEENEVVGPVKDDEPPAKKRKGELFPWGCKKASLRSPISPVSLLSSTVREDIPRKASVRGAVREELHAQRHHHPCRLHKVGHSN